MTPHNCDVCGEPGAIQTIKGRPIQRKYCDAHWQSYCNDKARARREAARAAQGLPPKPTKPQPPPGWTHTDTPSRQRPAANVTRLTLFIRRGLVRMERGAFMRETPLRYPERWQALVRFHLNTGFRLVSEDNAALVLEKAEVAA